MLRAMEVFRDDTQVTLGPCPGCELWQVDYTNEVALQWIELRVREEEDLEFGSEEPVALTTSIETDTSAWHDVIEEVLREHLDECPHLQRLLAAEGLASLYT